MTQTQELAAKFQSKFNELANKSGITDKKQLQTKAFHFWRTCTFKIENGKCCPFPEYLVQDYLQTL